MTFDLQKSLFLYSLQIIVQFVKFVSDVPQACKLLIIKSVTLCKGKTYYACGKSFASGLDKSKLLQLNCLDFNKL